ncbi:MAG TPA: hypothetical protein VNJ29_00560, partial [Candidatus Nitrosotenuis sp.]|nr:hypothetical protein [Candidatus Nitrosotenuis sp.]
SQKLQIQVDFMEANPDFAICHHSSLVVYENGERESHLMSAEQKEIMTLEDFVASRSNCILTASSLFRNHLFDDYPTWAMGLKLGDWVLHVLNAQHGKIKFINRTMSVYRIHSSGIWSRKKTIEKITQFAEAVEACKIHFAPRAETEFNDFLAQLYANICFHYFQDGKYSDFLGNYAKCRNYWTLLPRRSQFALLCRKVLSTIPLLAKAYNYLTTTIRKNNFRYA